MTTASAAPTDQRLTGGDEAQTITPTGTAYPRTIDNGVGERLTFLRVVPGPTGDRLEINNVVAPGAGPPMHVHLQQEESITVERGQIAYQRPGEEAEFAGPRETVVFAPGEGHRFWNPADEDLVCSGYIEPADSSEYYLTAMYDALRRSDSGRPSMFDAAFLATRYRDEFGMPEIPAAVQRIVFPVVVLAGRLLGRYGRYADAPEPVRH